MEEYPDFDLPDTISGLIRLALVQLDKALQEGCQYSMWDWHTPSPEGLKLDLVGAVMRLGMPDDAEGSNSSFPYLTQARLSVLNYLLWSDVVAAFACVELEKPPSLPDQFKITLFKNDPVKFKQDLLTLASKLEAVGY